MHKYLLIAFLLVALSGCMSATQHREAVQNETGERLTVGTVQREIKVGMTGAEVASVLGSPNIVTTDEERREVWVYDKVATESVYSESHGGVLALILGTGNVSGGVLPGAGASAGAKSTTQRTLTIIIKFDKERRVRDFAYHATKF
jgi:outer membrane protein assembly factor BamE (lipoprotein component of BamABCDE complex)